MVGCQYQLPEDGPGWGSDGGLTSTSGDDGVASDEEAADDESAGGIKLDVGDGQGGGDDGGNVFCDDDIPKPTPCDSQDDDPLHALGVNCDEVDGVLAQGGFEGSAQAMEVFDQTLGNGTYPAQEGSKYVVLSTGIAAQIALTPAQLEAASPECVGFEGMAPDCPSTELDGFDYEALPAPMDVNPVDPGQATTCEDDATLIGTGDCSNTLWDQWQAAQAGGLGGTGLPVANDYAEIRMNITVPDEIHGIGFDFAFMSVEYPNYYQSSFNDMFVAWAQSEQWTGNISFDEEGSPITVNAGFFDYKDAPNMVDCADCTAPELHGFAMQGHGGTRWLTSTTEVEPGEELTLIFSVFDLSDGILDSLVLLDNVRWTCGGPPSTTPVG
ncbi:MAG: choice-of-anchor L domain-containing protein [Myxococcota bacterium]